MIATGGTALALAAIAKAGETALQARASNRATDAQARAAREAMQYQRESDRNRGARYDRQYADYRTQYDAYMRHVYGDRYQPQTTASPAVAPSAAAPTAAPSLPPSVAPVAAPGAAPAAAPGVPPLVPPARPRSLADLGGWHASQYGRYLGRG